MAGYIKAHRNLFDPSHDLHPHACGEPACSAWAWLDLIAMAEWQGGRSRDRGSVDVSQRFLAARWNWHRSRVQRFLKQLEAEGRIRREQQANHGRDHITIVKFATYQLDGTTHRTTNRTTDRSKDEEQEEEQREVDAHASTSAEVVEWPEELRDVNSALAELEFLNTDLNDPAWWRKQLAWLDSTGLEVYAITELKNYAAWWESQSKSKRHRNLKRGLRNWLSTAVRWKEREQQRTQIGKKYGR